MRWYAHTFKNAKNAEHAEDLENAAQVGDLLEVLIVHEHGDEARHVVRQDGRQVDQVHEAEQEVQLPRRAREAQHVLQREPHCVPAPNARLLNADTELIGAKAKAKAYRRRRPRGSRTRGARRPHDARRSCRWRTRCCCPSDGSR